MSKAKGNVKINFEVKDGVMNGHLEADSLSSALAGLTYIIKDIAGEYNLQPVELACIIKTALEKTK